MNMKKLLIVTSIIFCCFFQLTSCEKRIETVNSLDEPSPSSVTNGSIKYDPNTLLDSDFELYNSDNSIVIRNSNTLTEIETKIDATLSKWENETTYKYQSVILCIRDNKYNGGYIIQKSGNNAMDFKTMREIKMGSTLEQIKLVYGTPTAIEDEGNLVFYVYKKSGDKYKILKKEEATGNMHEYYYIQFNLNSDKTVTKITMGDFEFVYNRK